LKIPKVTKFEAGCYHRGLMENEGYIMMPSCRQRTPIVLFLWLLYRSGHSI